MALTGFNPQQVSNSINGVITAYNKLMNEIGSNMQTKFVNGMQDKWACSQAQTFFTQDFKPVVDSLILGADETFESVVDSMNSAAQSWAQSTNYTQYNNVVFERRNIKMSVDCIQENINSVRGIDLVDAKTVANELPKISSAAKEALSDAVTAVSNCGFIGGDQQSYLTSSLNTIKTNIDRATETITTQVKTAIENTVSTYSDVEGKVSQAFNGQ